MAIEKYFVEGIDVKETIRNHTNIFDLCIGAKASKDYHYETVSTNSRNFSRDGLEQTYDRMIRYYVSTDGRKLLKVKNPDSEADGNAITQCEAGSWKCTIANFVDKNRPIEEYNIDYSYYTSKAEERIYAIEKGKKRKGEKPNPNQISLF